jgi:hypothetical protein
VQKILKQKHIIKSIAQMNVAVSQLIVGSWKSIMKRKQLEAVQKEHAENVMQG